MRQEDIDFLVRSNIPVNKYNIDNVESLSSRRRSFGSRLSLSHVPLDKDGINNIYDYTTTIFTDGIDNKIKLRERVSALLKTVGEGIDDIYRGIGDLEEEAKSSVVLENSMSGETKTILLELADKSIISNKSIGIVVQGNKLYADATTEASYKDAVRLEKYKFSAITAFMRSRESFDIAKIELVSETGVGYYPDPELDIINNNTKFRIEAASDSDISRNIDLIIDRKDSSLFNQVEISLEKAHIAMVYTSADGETYTAKTDKARYIKETSIQIEPTSDRFIKIVFNKLTFDSVKNGNNVYTVTVKSLSLLRTTFSGISTLITNPIEINGSYSKLALSVCDCVTEGEKGILSYFVSINESGWSPIRPAGRYEGETLSKSSTLNINKMVSNKFILLKDKVESEDGLTYTLALPEDFIRSNKLRVFSNDITKSYLDWEYERGLYSSVSILYEEKVIDFGPHEVSLNGKWVSGEVRLVPDIYRIKVKAENYANVILHRNNSIIDIGNGEFSVESDDGSIRTVYDPIYPYNHKYLLERGFDFIFEKELIEKEDYNIYNKDSQYFVSTHKEHEDIIIAYRLHESTVNSIKVKVDLQSEDFITIPNLEKIIIRLA